MWYHHDCVILVCAGNGGALALRGRSFRIESGNALQRTFSQYQCNLRVTVDDCSFLNNSASASGGAVAIDSGSISFSNSTLIDNHALLSGGGILLLGDFADIMFDSNSSRRTLPVLKGNSVTVGSGNALASFAEGRVSFGAVQVAMSSKGASARCCGRAVRLLTYSYTMRCTCIICHVFPD
jgi:predicted outer membrane repeat protein